MARARAETGIDIVDEDIAEPLARMIASLNADAALSQAGAIAMEARLLRILTNRLRMERDFRAHPEIADQPIVKPLFLTGIGRSGSTKLHKLIAASGDFKFTNFWQTHTLALRTGDRAEDPAPRIAESRAYIDWVDRTSPDVRLIHSYDLFEPEEESLIFEFCLFQPPIVIFANVTSYLQWYATQDFGDQLRFLKRAIQYLQWQFHDGDPRPWVLKCPIYPGFEHRLVEVFPDARMVATHRNPVASMPSMASLWVAFLKLYSDVEDPAAVGAAMLAGQTQVMRNHLAVRAAHPDLPILDVGYGELMRDSGAVMEKIYAHAGLPFTDAVRAAAGRWEGDNAQHKHGAHRYDASDFGLGAALVEERWRPYLDRYRDYL